MPRDKLKSFLEKVVEKADAETMEKKRKLEETTGGYFATVEPRMLAESERMDAEVSGGRAMKRGA